jgi:hypothetical protein
MRDAVRDNWIAVISQFEGCEQHMYRDTHKNGYVTCAYGNLIDPVELAQKEPWKHPSGSLATHAEIETEWHRVKAMPAGMLAKRYVTPEALHLDADAMQSLALRKLDDFWAVCVKRFDDAEYWPADAQLGWLMMAWALGPYFTQHGGDWPNFSAALEAEDWETAVVQCKSSVSDKRNKAHRLCFDNAYKGDDPDTLYFPDAA